MRERTPEWLLAKAAVDDPYYGAKARLTQARGKLEEAHRLNIQWEGDMAKLERKGRPIITGQEASARGDGAGYGVLYHHRHDDPFRVPFDESELAELVSDIRLAEKELDAAVAHLDEVTATRHDFDIWEGDHKYVWYPQFPTPTDYKGRPLSQQDLDAMGPALLQERLAQRVILERITATVPA